MSGLPRSLFELSTDLLAVFSADGRILRVNHRWRDVLGWSEDELVGRHYRDLVHPEDLRPTEDRALQTVTGVAPRQGYANRYRCKDGRYRWLLWETRELDAGDWLCSGRDITTERETMRELAALKRVATQVASADAPAAIYAAVAEEVGRLVDGDAAAVIRLMTDGRVEISASWTRQGRPTYAAGEVVEPPEPTSVADFMDSEVTRRDHNGLRDAVAQLHRYGSSVTAPISVAGTPWGFITALHVLPHGLPADAERRLGEFATLTAMAVANADARLQLERQALTDALTSLMNARAFHDRLMTLVAAAKRHGRPLCVGVLDIDEFKSINDRHGHRAGDLVLRRLGNAIRADQRLADSAGRIGGDEFAVALADCDAAGAVNAIERVRTDLADRTEDPTFTFSAGITELRPQDTVEDVMRRADELLYRSKHAGRDRTSTA